MIKEWLDLFTMTIASLAALIYLFDGTRSLTVNGVGRNSILMITFGIIACTVFGGIPYWVHTHTTTFLEYWDKTRRSEFPSGDDWGSHLDPEKSAEAKQTMARKIFIDSGKFSEFHNPSGQSQRFMPTEQDIKEREKTLLEIEHLRYTNRTNLNSSLEWLMSAIAAILFGLGFGTLEKRRRALAGVAPITSTPSSPP